jgi:hypothetical protein
VIGTGTVGVNGTFDIITSATFTDGTYANITATDTSADKTQTSAHSSAVTAKVDPTAPVITALVGQPVNGGTVELKGTGEVGETVNVYADGNMTTIVGTGKVAAGGTFDITTTANFAKGAHTFTATETDAANLTSSASPVFSVNVGSDLVPPPGQNLGVVVNPTNVNFIAGVDFSTRVINVTGGDATAGLDHITGSALYLIHTDINTTVADNGAIAIELPLDQLNVALGGDVVSISATLADGKPLPGWLQFDNHTGHFAGLVPDDIIVTGSIGPDGGEIGRLNDTTRPVTPQTVTIEVVARDSKGNLAVIDFTIDLPTKTLHKAERHGWNVLPGDKVLDRWATNRGRDTVIDLAIGADRDIAAQHAMDRVQWHSVSAVDIDRDHDNQVDDRAPAGRAGLSDQIKSHGWHAAVAERTALLESLRQGVAGWR